MSNKRVWKLALGLMLALPLASVAAGPGPDEGTATGQLLVGGKLMYRVAGHTGDDRLLVLKLRAVTMNAMLTAITERSEP